MIPRYRVMEALKSMQVQVNKGTVFQDFGADRKTFLGRIC
jgi:hypothetical protein